MAKRNSSLETGVMSKSLYIKNKSQVWDYYVKLSDYEAQCMYCENKYYYIRDTNLQLHIARNHTDIWKYEKERKLSDWPWKYFKYFNKLYSQCIICDATVLSTTKSVENHLNLHFPEQQNNICQSWQCKYWTRKDDFVVKCNICQNNVNLCISRNLNYHLEMAHSDKLKDTKEMQDTVGSSKRVLSFQMDTTMSLITVTKDYLWKYYVKLPNFKAKCMFCEKEYCYINNKSFQLHITRNHTDIWKYEKERKLSDWPWRYFKYFNKLYSQCIICSDATILSTIESTENHLSLHSLLQMENNVCQNWSWKYCIQKDDFVGECNICCKSISFGISKYLDFHTKKTHSDKLKAARETNDTDDSSKHVSSLPTDMMLSTFYIATKKNLWNYYIRLSEFEAQCMFCEKKYIYISYTAFQIHIAKCHKAIWKYEEERKLTKWPWMHFRYINELHSQCTICDANVLSRIETAENHLNFHSLQQLKNNISRNWIFKYCTQEGDFEVKCNICHKNITLYIQSYLNYHMKRAHSDKLEDMQETNDTAGSSKCVSSLETDTTYKLILSLKDCYVLLKKSSHCNLYI